VLPTPNDVFHDLLQVADAALETRRPSASYPVAVSTPEPSEVTEAPPAEPVPSAVFSSIRQPGLDTLRAMWNGRRSD
jgi:hypothetical protein